MSLFVHSVIKVTYHDEKIFSTVMDRYFSKKKRLMYITLKIYENSEYQGNRG
jgi:hypothetical protein